jgi:hypothetical protein
MSIPFNFVQQLNLSILFLPDVIGHVVERDVLKEKDVNGKKSKLIDITLEDNE